jgi:HD-like signal output (HDOD) protein
MLDPSLQEKLENITRLPTIPFIMSDVLDAVDDQNASAAALAKLIERDQALTAKVLAVANSPFYGFIRRISTIDLAIVVLGTNTIKEIVLSLIIKRFFTSIRRDVFDIRNFWQYSLFCGSSARVLARRLGYKVVGEAFVAGLMHDLGILIIVEYFSGKFDKIRKLQNEAGFTLIEAEEAVLKSTHGDIGFWFARKWNLPERLCYAIEHHHVGFAEVKYEKDNTSMAFPEATELPGIDEPLTAIVSMTEWFANIMGYRNWALEPVKISKLYLAEEIFEDLSEDDMLTPESALDLIKQEIFDEMDKASIFNKL